MEKNRPTTLMAYDAVIERVKVMHQKQTGQSIGARTWLAKELGISRQGLDNWSKRDGFPADWVARVSAATGIPQKLIRPKTLYISVSEQVWDLLASQDLKDQSVIMRRK